MWIKKLAYRVTQPVLRTLRNNRTIIRRLFGVRVPRGTAVQFDPTTVTLAHAVKTVGKDSDQHALEIGIGQGALISLSVSQQFKSLQIHGIDCSPSRVESSQKVAAFNGVEVNFFESNLFESVPPQPQFDLIFFNPPYVPTAVGEGLQLTEKLQVDGDQVWNGGEDGCVVLRQFLAEVGEYLAPEGRVVFGVQSMFVPDTKVEEVVGQTPFKIAQRITRRLTPAVAYVLTKASVAPQIPASQLPAAK